MNPERAYAAEQLLNFLQHVGPIEAVWAMTTALEQLQELSPGEDHVAAAGLALKESLDEFEELAAAAAEVPPAADQGGEGEPVNHDGTDTPPPADADAGDQGGEALLAETPATEPPAPEAPAKKSGKAS
jgi:hypothetical protein